MFVVAPSPSRRPQAFSLITRKELKAFIKLLRSARGKLVCWGSPELQKFREAGRRDGVDACRVFKTVLARARMVSPPDAHADERERFTMSMGAPLASRGRRRPTPPRQCARAPCAPRAAAPPPKTSPLGAISDPLDVILVDKYGQRLDLRFFILYLSLAQDANRSSSSSPS